MKSGIDKRSLFVCVLLVASTAAVYLQVGSHEFINYDDNVYITENSNVQKGLLLKALSGL